MKTRLIVNIHSISVGILERMPVTCPQVFDLHFQSATGLGMIGRTMGRALCSSSQNLDTNCGPRSDTIVFGTPCKLRIRAICSSAYVATVYFTLTESGQSL
jgi:hypothetical protein